ncbi:MAG: efflux RND transporter permease subunit [Cyanobacteria bacterium P01_F01_bin.150]
MLNTLARQFYRNGRLLALTLILIAVWGLSSYWALPRLEDPELIARNAVVKTFLPGASAERIEALITEPLENELTTIEELVTYQSTSLAGSSIVSLELNESVGADEVDTIWSRVRDKLGEVAVDFPVGSTEPELDEVDVKAYALIAAISWQSESSDFSEANAETNISIGDGDQRTPNYTILRRLATALDDQLQALPGTEATDLFGIPDEEILVEVESDQLASLGLTPQSLAQQLAQSDAKGTAGQFRGAATDLSVDIAQDFDSLTRLRQTPVEFGSNNQFVYLSDVARIEKGIVDPLSDMALVHGNPSVVVGTYVQSSTRIDQWAKNAKAALADFEAQLPSDIRLDVIFDQNAYVTTRLNELLFNLLMGALLVCSVTLIMMGWRSALIVGLSLPLSLLMVLGLMNLLGIPLHQMSITGLVVALGILIDTAIVMVDDVYLQMRQGKQAEEAMAQSHSEKSIATSLHHLAVPLLSSTITTVLAFMPIALIPGSAGEFVGTIGVNVILAISSSLLLALTVIPALATKLYERTPGGRRGIMHQGISFPVLKTIYRQTLYFTTRRPLVGIALALALPLVGFSQAPGLEQQFFPAADRDQLQIELELPAATSLSQTQTIVRQMRDRLIQHPDVEDVHWFLGENAPRFYYNLVGGRENESNFAQALVQLNDLSNADLAQTLQAELDQEFPQAQAIIRQLEQGPPFDAPIEVRIAGQDIGQLRSIGEEVRSRLVALDHVTHTRSSLEEGIPQLELDVDEESARLMGFDKAAIAQQLNTTLEGIEGGSILEATEELPVRVRLSSGDRGSLAQIESINLLGEGRRQKAEGRSGGQRSNALTPQLPNSPTLQLPNWVPLSSVATINLSPEQASITHYNGQRVNTIQGFLDAGILPDTVLTEFKQQLEDLQLPAGYRFIWGGEAAERDSAIGGLVSTVGVLGVLMVATLVLSLGSFRLAGVIGGVAIASFGLGLFSIALFGYPFGFNPIIGTVGLIGVAINDSIVVLAALDNDPKAKMGDRQAVQEVVMHSTRHVLTTTFTTMIGFVPLLLGGGDFWPPLAVAIAGGVGGATLLALYLIPSTYILLKRRQHRPFPPSSSIMPTTQQPLRRLETDLSS